MAPNEGISYLAVFTLGIFLGVSGSFIASTLKSARVSHPADVIRCAAQAKIYVRALNEGDQGTQLGFQDLADSCK